MDGQSPIINEELLKQLKELIPSAFTEGRLDVQRLKQALGEEAINQNAERYQLTWVGKSEAYKILQQSTSATLRPEPDKSIKFDTANHIFIEGENLEVLKVLQRSYFNKVKMIYIDPPYNTGNDSFIYPDKFSETRDDYLKRINDLDDNGELMREGYFHKNSKESGRYHSNWLSMMLPRLYLARNLLCHDGVIFVSIDDNEVHNLRLLMDEVFGEGNFVANCIRVGNSSKNNAKHFSITHDYTIIYAKSISFLNLNNVKKNNVDEFYKRIKNLIKNSGNHSNINQEIKELTKYPRFYDFDHYIYYDENGIFRANDLTAINSKNDFDIIHPISKLPCKKSNRGWAYNEDGIKKLIAQNKILFGEDEKTVPQLKCYLQDSLTQVPKSIFFSDAQVDTKWLKKQNIHFDFTKPVDFIKFLLEVSVKEDDIILDFFAGSGTTAQAVMELNKEDNGNRKYICVQLPEKCDKNSEGYKAGYITIADICRERIQRVINKLENQYDLLASPNNNLGFKSFKLTPSNFKQWHTDINESAENLQSQLTIFEHAEKDGAQSINLAYEILLRKGGLLTASLNQVLISNIRIYKADSCNSCFLIVLEDMKQEILKDLIALKPNEIIFLDKVFHNNDDLKVNTQLQCEQANIKFTCI